MEPTAISMIGEMIGELTGKVVGQRLVKHHGGEMMLERTFEEKGKILGVEVTFLATTWSRERPQGGMATKGHGIMMTKDGGKVHLHGSGITVQGKSPGTSIRGIRYAQTSVPSLIRLNNVGLVLEMEITPEGVMHEKWYEWK